MRRIGLRRQQRALDHRSELIVVDGSKAARAGLVKEALTAILQKSATPLANGMFVEAKSAATDLLGNPSAHRKIALHRSDSDRATR